MLGLAALLTALSACGSPDAPASIAEIAPASPQIDPGGSVQFIARVAGTVDETPSWSVVEPDGGVIDATGTYTAPQTEGTYTVLASFTSLSTTQSTLVYVKRNVRVSVSPVSATVAAGASLSLTASVTGSAKTVTWSVSEGAAGGSVTDAGVYTAPANAGVYHVVATSTADPTKSSTATITVTAPTPAPLPPAITISLSPQSASVVAGNTVQFSATVTGSTDTGVTWSVSESGGGTVNASGLYTAPATAGTYHVVATSQADTSKTASAAVTVTALPPPPPASGIVTAFPGAEGGGALSKGGRGGRVIEVTNLNDSGTGSLRACIEATGARTCVFRTGGTISLQSGLRITNPYITIAGQTAPGGGIQLRATSTDNHVLAIATHDVIVRYLRVRHGYTSSTGGGSGITIQGTSTPVENIIVDHCSVQWSQDDLWSVWSWSGNVPPKNLTWSWSIAAEPLKVHATAMINGSDAGSSTCYQMTNVDAHHSFLGSFGHRGPLLRLNQFRFVNNIVFDWRTWASGLFDGGSVDFVGNVYRRYHTPDSDWYHEIDLGNSYLYASGNIGPNNSTPTNDNWVMVAQVSGEGAYECSSSPCTSSNTSSPPRSYQRLTPLPALPAPITTVAVGTGGTTLQDLLLTTGNRGGPVGASRRLLCDGTWAPAQDAVDSRILSNYPTFGVYPVSEADVGGFPTLAAGTPCTDSDHDGMPDEWEKAHGLDPFNPADGAIIGPDGYSNLERYLNGP